ncbi:putative lipase [Gordonia hirsuta DSM 44140 = NBRC 16056]|uniref:Putative lipase n=1 Tax=Gordonia hirsuta DSM 44140 = NBRC 16056 TaxID=1121927 RepID=L7L8I3_9ACTN|nr:lipase family protein [Gordonia hirsuta]GAC56338.1 putative lipase [Gordonia hirsuta DSM 44140 = NBRC 16056]
MKFPIRARTVTAALAVTITGVLLPVAPTASAAPSASAPVPVAPAPMIPLPQELDRSFYEPPAATVAAASPGQILAARRIHAATLGLARLNVDAWQLSYRSTDTRGKPLAAVTTLLKPRGAGKGPRKVVSMQLAEDSTAGYCAPSYVLQQWSAGPAVGQMVIPAEMVIAQGMLAQGWALSLPDHQGPKHAYAAGPLGARITLDGLRAAKSFTPMGLSEQSPMALYGYSGGAIVTGHAAELKQTYAPELNVVGAAQGGVPADLRAVLNYAQHGATSGLILAAIAGLANEYDDFARFLDRRLNPEGKLLMAAKRPLCVGHTSMLLPFLNNKGFISWPGDPLDAPAVERVLRETKMGASVPDMPLYIWQSQLDEIIPVGQVNTLVKTYCRDPEASVRYTRDHLSEHILAEIAGAPAAVLWLKDRLDGIPADPGCTTHDVLSKATDARWWPAFAETVGANVAAIFGAQIGRGK